MKRLILLSLICVSQFINGQPANVIPSQVILSDHEGKNNFSDNAFLKNLGNKMVNGKIQPANSSKIKSNAINHALLSIYLVDSSYSWILDNLSNVWNLDKKTIFTYDVDNNNTKILYQKWNGSAFVNYTQRILTFDANHNQTSYLKQTWDSIAWVNFELDSYTFDANNNETSMLNQRWQGGVLVNFFRLSKTYDASNNLTSSYQQFWDSIAWVNSSLQSFTYDADNNKTNYFYQTWNNSSWVNQNQATFTYDANNNNTSYLYQSWEDSLWVNLYLYTYTYSTDNDLANVLTQDWEDSSWVNSDLSSFAYDSDHNQTSFLYRRWNSITWENIYQLFYIYDAENNLTNESQQVWRNGGWVNTYQYNFTFDANNFKQFEVNKYFDISGQMIYRADSIHYYFHTPVGFNELTTHNEGIIAYPNPFSNVIKIAVNGNINKISEAVLFDALGKEISREKITTEETILNTEKLLPGFYLLTYTDGNKTTNTKLLKF